MLKLAIRKISLTLLGVFVVSFASFAGIHDYTKVIQATSAGSPILVGTANAVDSVEAQMVAANHVDISVINRVTFGIDLHNENYIGSDMDVTVYLTVKRWNDNLVPMSDTNLILSVAYNPFNALQMISSEMAEFNGAYKLVFTIDAIEVDGVAQNDLPLNMYVQGDIIIDQVVELDVISSMSTGFIQEDKNCDGTYDHLKINWTNITGAEEYQLEWLHINDYTADLNINNNVPESALEYNFKYNSTRIATSYLEYDLSLLFDRGWVVFRVRPVGVDLANPDQVIFGNWNVAEFGTVDQVSVSGKYPISNTVRHEPDLNWEYSANYAEEGKKKETIIYYDGSLRNRQTVTRISSDENILVGETIYDHQGRPAINVLPTPVDPECTVANSEPTIHLYRNYNRNLSDVAYDRTNFDLDDPNAACGVAAEGMNDNSGSSQYYSPQNPNTDLEQAYVPDALLYPFSQTEYTPDNTGRIRRQGGVGPEFQLGSGNETKYFYGQPNQLELDRLFGSEMGDVTHYKKNVVIDAHGQASVSYLDQEGRVIATALAGEAPVNFEAIPSAGQNAELLTIDAFGDDGALNEVSINNNSLVFSTQLLVAFESNYNIDYDFTIDPLQFDCLADVCVDCVYDLTIEFVDECGVNLMPTTYQTTLVGNFGTDQNGYTFHATCTTPPTVGTLPAGAGSFAIPNVPPGAYSLNKILTINEDARQAFVDLYLASDCSLTLQDFIDEEMANIDTSDCNVTCDDCFDNLGTLEDFIANGEGSANDYYLRVEDCERACQTGMDICAVTLTLMEMDMSPGGQYGEYLDASGAYIFGIHPLSIYNPSNVLPGAAYWNQPQLITQYGIDPIFVDDNGDRSKIYVQPDPVNPGQWLPATGVTPQIDPLNGQPFIYPEQLMYNADFVDLFELSWAKSLVPYHPEYCYYEECIKYEVEINATDDFTSTSFDDLMNTTFSFQEAITNGFIVPGGNSTTGYTIEDWSLPPGTGGNPYNTPNQAWDPFMYYSSQFSSTGCIDGGAALENKMQNYKFIDGNWYSMAEVAAYLARCGTNFYTTPSPSCFDFGGLYNGTTDPAILDEEWNYFRSFYTSEKQQLKQQMADCKAILECDAYGGCIGNDGYNPYTSGMIGPYPGYVGLIFSSPFWDNEQPCSVWTYGLYEGKTRRFTDAESAVPETNASDVAYQMFLQTGQCPIPFTLQTLMNEITQAQELDGTNVDLNNFSGLASLFLAANDFNNPGTIPDLTYDVISTGTNSLVIEWTDISNVIYATMTLNMTANPVPWDDLTGFVNLYPTGGTGFTAQGISYDLNNDLVVTEISGTLTTFDLGACEFAFSCSSNDLAVDLTTLMNTLVTSSNLIPAAALDFNPLIVTSPSSATLALLATPFIVAAADIGTNVHWKVNASNNGFIIVDPLNSLTEGLEININSYSPNTFGWTDLSTLPSGAFFDNMVSTGQNSFEMTVHYDIVDPTLTFVIEGDLIRNTGGTAIGIEAGDCDLPTPVACETVSHEMFTTLEEVLFNSLITEDYTGAPGEQVDIFASTSMTQTMMNELTPATFSTSTLTSNDQILTISAEDCDMTLTVDDPTLVATIPNLINFTNFILTGTADNYGDFHTFEFTGTFDIGGGNTMIATVAGLTCLPMKDCEDCAQDALIPIEEDSIAGFNQAMLDAGILIPDNSATKYVEYTSAIDSLNLRLNLTPVDSTYIVAEDYGTFFLDGNEYPSESYIRFIDNFVPELDNPNFLSSSNDFSTEYGYGTNVKAEYVRYLGATDRYNLRADTMGGDSLIVISEDDFINSRVADNNATYIGYLETRPTVNENGQDILTFLAASPSAVSTNEQLYKQYTDAYKIFVAEQESGSPAIVCKDYKRYAPLYSYKDFQNNKLFCSAQGQQDLQDYIASFQSGSCPIELPKRVDCSAIPQGDIKAECQKLYVLYKKTLKKFNNSYWSNANGYELDNIFSSMKDFINSPYKPCVKSYIAYLQDWINSNDANNPSSPPISLLDFPPCGGDDLEPETPCADAYDAYITCIKEYNSVISEISGGVPNHTDR